ncbi:hypothetical protein PISMIDRAFT_348055 [Pisolithus microcarpus 441]|uniref:Uncharacterized protein n=1 Tax=Pisolithus microcarpus 441 TaxID=765257 RepID=A0A0C9YL66_9AGAM|nr:hypothetical protein PISMIDRAFT_348055 [Pisolithus microcarpus 441]
MKYQSACSVYEPVHIHLFGSGSLSEVHPCLQFQQLALEDLRVEDHLKFLAGNLPEIQPLNLTLAPPSDELASVTHIEAKVGVGAAEHYTEVNNSTAATSFFRVPRCIQRPLCGTIVIPCGHCCHATQSSHAYKRHCRRRQVVPHRSGILQAFARPWQHEHGDHFSAGIESSVNRVHHFSPHWRRTIRVPTYCPFRLRHVMPRFDDHIYKEHVARASSWLPTAR